MKPEDTNWTFPKTTGEMEERFPLLVRDMIDCAQNPEYHEEGNVWLHTKMVINAMESDPEFNRLPLGQQEVLRAAAFYHDIAKPKVSSIEDGVIRSKKHAVLGARMVRELLWNYTLPEYYPATWQIREYISNLVLLHMLPFYFVSKENPVYSVGAASMVISNNDLAILGRADTEGRVCKNMNIHKEGVDTAEWFTDFCEENDCLDKPMKFLSNKARFRFFFEHKGDPNLDYYQPEKGTVVIMSGIQGSGKDYTISKNYSNLPVVGFDNIREELGLQFGKKESKVETELKERTKEYMRSGQNFVFNATNTIKDIRSTWVRRFRKYDYKIKIHYVEKSLETTLENNRNRKNVVPDGIIFEKFSRLDVPTQMECHELITEV